MKLLILQISYDQYYTERRVVSDMAVQQDIGSAQLINSPKFLICCHQTKDRTSALDKKTDIGIFDNLDLRKYHVEIDSIRYPRDSLLMNYEQNEYIEQCNDLKIIFEEYIGEPLLSSLISYPHMTTKLSY